MRRNIIIFIAVIAIIGVVIIWHTLSSKTISLEPDHLEMLVSLDGEENEYYEELILRHKGWKVDSRKVSWQSEDSDIAEVDEYGWVTSMGVGTTKITARYKGSVAECTVEVTQKITSDTLGE